MNPGPHDDNFPSVPPRRLRYPAMVELIILGGVVLLLMIGLWMIRSLVSERAKRGEAVRREIASSWAQSQIVGGPVLIVPFRVPYTDVTGKPQFTIDHARFLPQTLKTSGRLLPERRHRGIFETVVYRADLAMEGRFTRPDFSAWNVAAEDVLWNEAVITIGITDLRGIRGNPVLRWNGGDAAFSGGSGDSKLWTSGLTAPVPMSADAAAKEPYPFKLALSLNGSEEIHFLPLGAETIVELSSPWPDPSFAGAFLPDARTVGASGFTARWTISSLARSYPQKWRDSAAESLEAIVPPTAFGV